ncbi:MAG: ABC transporter substrate-binding protein [Thermoanaerobaculia bacterium]
MRRGWVALVLVSALAAGACRKEEAPLRVAIHSAPLSLDPHLQNEVLTQSVLANLYDGLTEFDQESRIRPALAAEWRNPDDRTWVFRLRPGVRFHDGRSLEAADVVFSLERARTHPRTGFASYLVEVENVRALDPLTVEIRTKHPFAALLVKLSPILIVPRGSPETISRPVGTGSYRLGRDEEGKALELVPAESGWRAPPARAPLTFVVERDPRRRLERLLAGEVDVAAGLQEDAVDVLRKSRGCRSVLRPGSVVEYLHLSLVEPRFRDRRVREAIDLAVDQADFVSRAHHGLGQPVGQLVASGVFGWAPDLKPMPRDLPRARRLLAEAGFPRGFDVVLEQRLGRRGDVLAGQLAEAGIRATLRESPWPELHERLRRGEVPFYFGGVVAQTGESSDVLDGFVHTRDEARGYGITNHSRYSNPRADALIEEAATMPVMLRRRDLLQEAMRVVMADLEFVPIAGLYDVYGVRDGVRFTPRLDLKLLGREIARP